MTEGFQETLRATQTVRTFSTERFERGGKVTDWRIDRDVDSAADETISVVFEGDRPVRRRRGPALPASRPSKIEAGTSGDWSFDLGRWFEGFNDAVFERLAGVEHGDISLRCDSTEYETEFHSSDPSISPYTGRSRWVAGAMRVREHDGSWNVLCFDSFEDVRPEEIVDRVVSRRRARRDAADARPILGDTQRVVLDEEVAATFFHEAVGHWLESDFASPEREGLMGRRLATNILRVDDDPTRPGPGHMGRDDEGVECAARPLIAEGELVDRISDRNMTQRYRSGRPGNGVLSGGEIRPRMSNLVVHSSKQTAPAQPDRLVLHDPIAGRFDGHQVSVTCASSTWPDGEPGPAVTIESLPQEALASIDWIGPRSKQQRLGGGCAKSGSWAGRTATWSPMIGVEVGIR